MQKKVLLYSIVFLFSINKNLFSQKFDFAIEAKHLWSSSVFQNNDQQYARSSIHNLNLGFILGYNIQNKYRISIGRRNHKWFTMIPIIKENNVSASSYISVYYHFNIGKRISYKSFFVNADLGLVYRNMDRVVFEISGETFMEGTFYNMNSKNIGLKSSLTLGYGLPYNLQLLGSIDYQLFKETPNSIVGFHFGLGAKF